MCFPTIKWFQVIIIFGTTLSLSRRFVLVKFGLVWFGFMAYKGTTTQGQSGSGNDSNKKVSSISQTSRIIGASPSDCIESYPGTSLRKAYLSAEMQSEYSAVQTVWASLVS